MNTNARLLALTLAWGALAALSFGQELPPVASCRLSVRFDPPAGMIEAKAEIRDPRDTSFILNKDMAVHRILVDGAPVAFHQNLQYVASNFMPNTAEIVYGAPGAKSLVVEYGGPIKPASFPPMVNVANMVNADLVELAVYVCWYPKLKNNGTFTYRLDADLPESFVTVANGSLESEKTLGDRRLVTWKSNGTVWDIAFVAAPNLHRSVLTRDGATVEIYHDKVPASYVDSMKSNLLVSMERLTALLGPPQSERLIRVAYSPRKTWGYVRVPLIIVSEDNALTWRSQKFGPARDFRYLTHEIAHYWWGFADPGTPDDWINEGLAEYSALLVSEHVVGKEFVDQLLGEYKGRAAAGKTETAIAETEGNSPDREVNRYDKPALLFREAQMHYGDARWFRFLKGLYVRFAVSKKATTALFLDEMGKELGPEARESFSRALYSRKWVEVETRKK